MVLAVAVLMVAGPQSSEATGDLETSVCGWKEPIMFWLWRRVANRAAANEVARAEDISCRTRDGRMLKGLRQSARPEARKGYVLFAQGNAMLASVVTSLTPFSNAGLDVYVYDFRGYGRSEGKARLRAIVTDYRDIIAALNQDPRHAKAKRYLYGVSFGGIVLTNAAAGAPYDAMVIDSSPASIASLGCATHDFDPVRHVPADARRVMVISGGRDSVVPHGQVKPLSDAVASRGGTALHRADYPHPFQEPSSAMFVDRLRAVLQHFERY